MSFAFVVGKGPVQEIDPKSALDQCGNGGFVWIHLSARNAETIPWLRDIATLPDIVVSALTAAETRPRCEPIGTGALVNLRGPAVEPGSMDDSLASVRMWTERGRVISVGRNPLLATPLVMDKVKSGAVTDPGDLVTAFAVAVTEQLDPVIADLGDTLDDCELGIEESRHLALRHEIAKTRSEAIGYRRFVAPQRQALERLATLQCDWLDERDRLHLAEAADRFARMAEELESVRERAALMHEQLTDLRAEVIETRGLLISVVALIFLPLTFLTGLLGMNVEGIPYAHEAWAFWGVVGVCLFIAAGIGAYFIKAHWFPR
jgi:zinc transporter